MTPLEDELRGSLARQAGCPSPARPDPDQLADRVIRRARRLRSRRWFGGTAAVLAVVVGAGLGLVHSPQRRPAPVVAQSSRPQLLTPAAQQPPTVISDVPGRLSGTARSVPRLPVDVIADDQLVTVDGSAIDLSFASEVSQAYRVDDGWLVVGQPAAATGKAGGWGGLRRLSVWLVTPNGHRKVLLADVAGVAFDTGGRLVAWRSGARVLLGTLTDGRISKPVHAASITGTAVPVGFVSGGVLLDHVGVAGFDVWWPESGVYRPAWAQNTVEVYGSLADGRTAVGQVVVDASSIVRTAVGERRCLALFDVALPAMTVPTHGRRQAPVQIRCALSLAASSPGWVSPDGHWLVTGASGRTVLVDLTAKVTAPRVISTGLPFEGGVAWLDKRTVVLATSSRKAVMRLRVDQLRGKQADGARPRSVPVGAKEALLVVPKL